MIKITHDNTIFSGPVGVYLNNENAELFLFTNKTMQLFRSGKNILQLYYYDAEAPDGTKSKQTAFLKEDFSKMDYLGEL